MGVVGVGGKVAGGGGCVGVGVDVDVGAVGAVGVGVGVGGDVVDRADDEDDDGKDN